MSQLILDIPHTSTMKALPKIPWQFLAIFLSSSCGIAKKTCKAGEVDDASQHFHMTRSKCKICFKLHW